MTEAGETAKPDIKKRLRLGSLDFPPEVRNLIYGYTLNEHYSSARLIRQPDDNLYNAPWTWSPRALLGFTQVCKVIRAEFRPLWLARFTAKIRFDHLDEYLKAYFSRGPLDWQNTPALLELLADDRVNISSGYPIDMMSICQLLARSPFSQIHLEDMLVDRRNSKAASCKGCNHFVWDDPPEWCGSHDEAFDADYDNAADYEAKYPYLTPLNSFVEHDNETWLQDIDEENISQISFAIYDGDLLLRIRYSEEGAEASRALCNWDICETDCDCGISLSETHFLDNVGFTEWEWFDGSSFKVLVEDEKILFEGDQSLNRKDDAYRDYARYGYGC